MRQKVAKTELGGYVQFQLQMKTRADADDDGGHYTESKIRWWGLCVNPE